MKPGVISKIALFAAFGPALLSGAAAQQNDDGPVAGTVKLGAAVQQFDVIASGWRASKLIGASVYNYSDQRIGKVGDLIIAPDGSLSVAIVDVGGFLGIGTHHVAIPIEQFTQVSPKIILPGATQDALKQLPEFKYTQG